MGTTNKLYGVVALLALLMLAVAAVTFTSRMTDASGSGTPCAEERDDAAADTADTADGDSAAEAEDTDENECEVTPGTLDDGAELLPQAGITVAQAIAAARGAANGSIGEIDLEDYNGTLAFNVDVGDQDVKVAASTGEVLGIGND